MSMTKKEFLKKLVDLYSQVHGLYYLDGVYYDTALGVCLNNAQRSLLDAAAYFEDYEILED